MTNVLVTNPFAAPLLDRLRDISPSIRVTQAEAGSADYSDIDVLYTGSPPDPATAPKLKWAQLHMAGVDSIREHPIFAASTIALTTTSGIAHHAQYALQSCWRWRRLPRMVDGRNGSWRRTSSAGRSSSDRAGGAPQDHRLRQHRP
jgi:phosphoglycerate dehydrogenase-like enzyme